MQFHQLTEIVDLVDVLLGHLEHDIDAPAAADDEAFADQLVHGFADWRAADAEHGRQMRLEDAGAGLDLVPDDRFLQSLVGFFVQRLTDDLGVVDSVHASPRYHVFCIHKL
ncbi:hypothetical protein SDC9_187034 [bioreactor metagenome]|uniref:Uncharacterized protein n=1 Tax=bioreactor metagenome TaxID=1076179 RepID=A0A645HLU8_9ZZZZ